MTVSKYTNCFLYFSQFSRHIIPIEREHAKKIVEGLNDEYFKVIEVFEEIIDEIFFNRVIKLEVRKRARKREREMQSKSKKRSKFKGTSGEPKYQTFLTLNMSFF